MYVSPISSRFWLGRFTPAIRAMLLLTCAFSALALLVARVAADHHRATVPLDDATALTHGLHRRTNFHTRALTSSERPGSDEWTCGFRDMQRDGRGERLLPRAVIVPK